MNNNMEAIIEKLKIAEAEKHIFLCCDQKKPKCCDLKTGLESWDFLKKKLMQIKKEKKYVN